MTVDNVGEIWSTLYEEKLWTEDGNDSDGSTENTGKKSDDMMAVEVEKIALEKIVKNLFLSKGGNVTSGR